MRDVPRRYRINSRCQPVVALGYSITRVVGAQAKFHHVVLVAEPGVMVEPLGFSRYFGEESKGGFEIDKAEAMVEAILGFNPHIFCYI